MERYHYVGRVYYADVSRLEDEHSGRRRDRP